MGLSNYLPSSRLIQPGVCTSSTRPASPFEGQYIYETDTNRTLVYDGGAWVMTVDADSPPGMVLIKTQTIGTAVSSVTVSDVFSSEYDNYRFTITGGSGSGAAGCTLKLGSTTTGYYNGGIGLSYAGATVTGNNNNTLGFWSLAGLVTTDSIVVDIDLYGPNLAKRTYYKTAYIYGPPGTTGGDFIQGGGYLDNATSYTSFTWGPAGSATATGGTIRVYGYRNTI